MENFELYFNEPRLKMTALGRLFFRAAAYSAYGAATAAGFIFILSDVGRLHWLGLLIFLFLGDRLLHFGEAEKPLPEKERALSAGAPAKAGRFNVAEYLTPPSLYALIYAFERANGLGGSFFVFLIKKLLSRREITDGLRRLDVVLEQFGYRTDEALLASVKKEKTNYEELIRSAAETAKAAFLAARFGGDRFVEPKDVFAAAAFLADKETSKIFSTFSIEPADLERALVLSSLSAKLKRLWKPKRRVGAKKHRIMNRAWTSRPTPVLDSFSADFTSAQGGAGGMLVGHEKEYDRLVDVLSRFTRANVLLIGEAGAGRETLVRHLAYQIVKDEVPPPLFDKRLVALEVGALAAGAGPAEVEARVKAAVREIEAAGNVILYVPDVHNILKTSGAATLSAADVFLPLVADSPFPVIGATFPREYKQLIEPRSDFKNLFEVIRVEELNEDEAVRILIYESAALEAESGIMISFGAVKEAVRIARKYFRQKPLPGSAADLLKEALADARDKERKILDAAGVVTVAEKRVNVPIHKAGREEAEKLLNLEGYLHKRFIDQEPAVSAVARALREYRSGLSRQGGPIASFLFVGPTGVGKTELSKILARVQFGSEEAMARFDMSEYQDKQSVFKLIGSPDLSVSGVLTDRILEKPYSLILLDEFEKSHSGVLNLFLQVLDDGRLTDASGRTVDFQNTVIIATSNAHSAFIKSELEKGKTMEDVAAEFKKKLVEYFPPELLNRFSDIVLFKELSPIDLEAVVRLQLETLSGELEEARGIVISFDETVVRRLAVLGYDPAFGARPLRGVISEKIRGVLAEKILAGEVDRGQAVRVLLENDSFGFKISR